MKSTFHGISQLWNRSPVPYVSRASAHRTSILRTDARDSQLGAMGANGTLFSIVNRTSNSTAQVQWKLWRTSTTGRVEDREEVTNHLALKIWNKPNRFFTQQELVETFQQHLDLTGEAWLVVGRDSRASFPMELWPVRPDRMQPIPNPTDYLTGYEYRSPDGEVIPLKLDEVIQLRMPNPLDSYRGMGPVQTILAELDATRYSAEWNRNFFLNSAEPGGIIELPDGVSLSDEEFDEMTARWDEQHRGVARAHRVAILERGKWIDRKYTQRDMQFVELRNVSRDVIREAFGIPKFALGDVDDVNRATAEAAEVVFSRWTVKPRLERIKQALNNDFLPLFGSTGQGVEFDYCDPTPDDEELDSKVLLNRANSVKALIDAGLDPAGALQACGMPEIRAVSRPQPTPAPGQEA